MKFFLIILIFLQYSPSFALVIEDNLQNPQQEQQARELFTQIACMSCDGESIIDSKAESAAAMRSLIRDEISKGTSEEEIIAILKRSYGDAVLLKPDRGKNMILYGIPLLLLGGFFSLFVSRKS